MEEESLRRNHGGGIIEEESLRRNHGGGIIEKESLRRNHGGGIMEEESEESWKSNHGGIWEASGDIWEASGRHLGGIHRRFSPLV